MVSVVCGKILESVPEIIKKTFPIPGKFRSKLPSDIAELSRLLTNNRGERSLSYMTRPNYLSAYLHYFLPWNLYRLCILLSKLDLKLSAGNIITDFGCGPLTFACALWITYPDLRKVQLEINCVDRASPALEAGRKLFSALCSQTEKENANNWKINLIKSDINIKSDNHRIETNDAKKTKFHNSSLICTVNMFNEMYDRISHNNTEELRRMAVKTASFLHREAKADKTKSDKVKTDKTKTDASILIVEPGIPQSGRFISFLREAFIELGRVPSSPCTHSEKCPLMPSFTNPANIAHNADKPYSPHKKQIKTTTKEKWCHFAFDTTDASKSLKTLSAAAKLPKERVAFSYLFADSQTSEIKTPIGIKTSAAQPKSAKKNDTSISNIRVISDAFSLPQDKFGRYACSSKGLVLLRGEKQIIEKLLPLDITDLFAHNNNEIDEKSGAIIVEVT